MCQIWTQTRSDRTQTDEIWIIFGYMSRVPPETHFLNFFEKFEFFFENFEKILKNFEKKSQF